MSVTKKNTLIIYLRISSEDKTLKAEGRLESHSIANQRLIIQEYIKRQVDLQQYEVVELVDDGYSGTNFDRPAITKAFDMLWHGEAQCMIVKDLSRFGRNYINVGNFLEQIFPFLGVRFISVNDCYDSKDPACVGSMVTVFKTMFADIYSKDLSAKVKNALYHNAKNGKYINALPPYGYVKTKTPMRTLQIDEEAAAVVRWIFNSYVEGKSRNEIARELNRQMTPTPMQHKNKQGLGRKWERLTSNGKPIWTGVTVYGILRDERYIGTVIYSKTVRKIVGNPYQSKNKKEDWIVAENMHENIVSLELFQKAQARISKCQVGETKTPKSTLDKKVRCGVCGKVLTLVRAKKPFFYCKTRQFTDMFSCADIRVETADLYDAMLSSICSQAEFAVNMEEILWIKNQGRQSETTAKTSEIKRCEAVASRLKNQQKELFQSYMDGKIDKTVFQSKNAICITTRTELDEKLKLLTEELRLLNSENELDNWFIKAVRPYAFIEELSDDAIGNLIESVRVFEDNSIEISWKFRDEFNMVMTTLQE